ncbi:protein of unknown function [Chryseobacterium sp. JV274]|nr:protein of unknown function [Chryseobacterium sp. JV274]
MAKGDGHSTQINDRYSDTATNKKFINVTFNGSFGIYRKTFTSAID